MDPQSVAFPPQGDAWRVQSELLRVQSTQTELSDRLSLLEKKLQDDARMKSVWGGASPFPSVLSSTLQQTPLHQPESPCKDSDDETVNFMSALQLDVDDEPRRLGPGSRANSVRFDESANQGHWVHASRTSLDFAPTPRGLSMNERCWSHRSDGRASSVHSMRSAASGRTGSITLDNGFSLGDSARSPIDTPLLAPGIFVLGTVPAIIRCWMNSAFKHDSLLYAAVCSGSHRSWIDLGLVNKLGLSNQIDRSDDESQSITLRMCLPEAIPHPASSSRTPSPVPQLPTVTVNFAISEACVTSVGSKAIRIIVGSDTLRLRSADVLFSSNSISLYDDERVKLSIPMVRPEEEKTFTGLQTVTRNNYGFVKQDADLTPSTSSLISGLGQRSSNKDSTDRLSSLTTNGSASNDKYRPPGIMAADADPQTTSDAFVEFSPSRSGSRPGSRSGSRSATPYRPTAAVPLDEPVKMRDLGVDTHPEESQARNSTRSGSSPAVWSNWRREGSTGGSATGSQFDWANGSKTSKDSNGVQQRRDGGIKVLRPLKATGRTLSTSITPAASAVSTAAATPAISPSPSDGRSRFFDEGKRRAPSLAFNFARFGAGPAVSGSDVAGSDDQMHSGVGVNVAPKPRSNPVGGGGSAFSWLNDGSGSK